MALNSLISADVPLRNYSLTRCPSMEILVGSNHSKFCDSEIPLTDFTANSQVIKLVGWSLMALSAQKGYNVPCRN